MGKVPLETWVARLALELAQLPSTWWFGWWFGGSGVVSHLPSTKSRGSNPQTINSNLELGVAP